MTPSIIISKCCKTVVGCEKCVNEWCRAERGYNETYYVADGV